MGSYIARRLLGLVPLLIGVTFVVFLFVHLIPGDPARVLLGEKASPEAVARIRAEMGLDAPLPVQYSRFLAHVLRGDLGRSLISRIPVAEEIAARFPATVELAVAAMLVGLVVGLPAGLLAGARPDSAFDRLSMTVSLLGVSVPVFWLGLLLIWAGVLLLGWFPASGRLPATLSYQPLTGFVLLDAVLRADGALFWAGLQHLALPALTLGTIPMANIARITRASVIEAMREDYIRTARAKGLPERRVLVGHALRNAWIPVLTVLGLQFGSLLAGAVLTESVFAWPGIGRLVYQAVLERDFPLIQGCILLISVTFVLVNLAVDVLYAYVDPRIRWR